MRKISPQPGFDPWTVQPVVSRYTDYATRHTTLLREDDKHPTTELFILETVLAPPPPQSYPGPTLPALFCLTSLFLVNSFIPIPILLSCRLRGVVIFPPPVTVAISEEKLGMTSDHYVRTCRSEPSDEPDGNGRGWMRTRSQLQPSGWNC